MSLCQFPSLLGFVFTLPGLPSFPPPLPSVSIGINIGFTIPACPLD